MTIRRIASFALSTCLLASACASDADDNDLDTDDDVASEEREIAAAETASVAVDNAGEPAYVGGLFTASASGSDAGGVIAAIQANLALVFALPACTTVANVVLDSEGPSTLDVTFDECEDGHGNLLLDGSLHASILVTGDPLTVSYGLETDGLTVGNRTIAGAWDVHHVFGEGPSTWSGDLTVTGPNGTLTSSTDASFEVDGLCVTYALDAEVATSDGDQLSVHADEVTRCLAACPTAGHVIVEGAGSGSITWDYDGDGSVTATGSAAGSFQLELGCE